MEYPRNFGQRLRSTLQPGNTDIVALRPLNFGMDTLHPRSMVKLRNLLNGYAAEDGWKQRPALATLFTTVPLASGETITDFVDMGIISAVYGSFVAIGTSFIYASQDGVLWTRCPWIKDHYVSTSGTTGTMVKASAATFQTDLVMAGMTVNFKDALGEWSIERTIGAVVSETELTLTEALPSLPSADFRIYYQFRANDPYRVQWTKGPDRIYLVDTSDIGIISFDGMYLSRLNLHDGSNAAPFDAACAIKYSQGYLIVGNVTSTNGYRSLYWSDVTDVSNFQSINYVVLTLSSGPVMSISTIENYLVVATQDDLYVGKPYQGYDLTYVMPWIFKRLETSGRVPVGQGAICSALNSIFYIGPDDLYALSFAQLNAQGDFVVTPIESTIRKDAFYGDMHQATLIYEPETENILIARSGSFSSLWAMNIRTKSWSKWDFGVELLSMARTMFAPRETYATMLAAGRVPTTYGSWAASKLESSKANIANGETLTIGTKVYTWKTAIAVEGDVLIGLTYAESLQYMAEAIGIQGETRPVSSTHHACAADNPDVAAWQGTGDFNYILNLIARTEGALGEGIAVSTTAASLTITGATTAISTAISGRSYQSFLIGFGTAYVVFSMAGGNLVAFDFDGFSDFGTSAIQFDIETGDMDFDMPSDVKGLYRLGISGAGAFRFYLSGSTNRGLAWKQLGFIDINNSEDELHFRLSGDKIALKFLIRNIQSKVAIEEIAMSIKVTGESVIRGGK